MSTKKTIQINPELFKLPSNKTRKNREKKELNLVPIVSPSSLKNKLLKRIKEHKTKEFHSKINENMMLSSKKHTDNSVSQNNNDTDTSNYNDEFYGAINYLSDLAKKTKQDTEKQRYQRTINNKTLKQFPSPLLNNEPMNVGLYVASNLPPELQTIQQKTNYFIPEQNSNPISLKYKPDNDIPYGCLKGGVKPSYKSWIQTRKNYEHPELENIGSIRPPTPPKRNTFIDSPLQAPNTNSSLKSSNTNELTREERLERIKHKLRALQEQENMHKPEYTKLKKDLTNLEPIIKNQETKNDNLPEIDGYTRNPFLVPEILSVTKENNIPKKYVKKTIRRKYTLGKSSKMRKVGVLIKDNKTRKDIINAQKELKKTNITDMRKYLRKRGTLKVGSLAPPELIRKTFEASMMAGDVTNTNKDTLLHNFIHDES
jgi:hypothetical protein